jgi:O-methyltransferase
MEISSFKKLVKACVPQPMWMWMRKQGTLLTHPPEFNRFVSSPSPPLTTQQRNELRVRYLRAHGGIYCAHTHAEILAVTDAILSIPSTKSGIVVEAGCFKGGSTAKLSIVAHMTGRQLVIFDSFEGLPAPDAEERHDFYKGEYAGALKEVRGNVQRYGEIAACRFVQGWFSNTMPSFHEPVCVAFVDVDLADSVRTCLKHLYPLLVHGGVIFSHDGHVPACVAVMRDERFWVEEVGVNPPPIRGLGTDKLVRIEKPNA